MAGAEKSNFLSQLQLKVITVLIHVNEYLIFYPRLKKFYLSHIKQNKPFILDVGSNKGQTIDFFLKLYPDATICGFEPNGELYKDLCLKYKGDQRVRLYNLGVSNTNGKLLFKETITSETSTFEDLNYDSEYLKMKSRVLGVTPESIVKKAYEVDVITLADFINNEKIEQIDILKIDTEGHEYKCLLGLFTKKDINIQYIQLEQHNGGMYTNRVPNSTIDDLLHENNFHAINTIEHGFGDFKEVIYKSGK